MKCARLHLQERYKSPKVKPETSYAAEKPLRYCQKRMINPEHEEDPRWANIHGRFHCDDDLDNSTNDNTDSSIGNIDSEDLFLSVQTLKFQGNVEQLKRSRSNFKYKSPGEGVKHRMFVKQQVNPDNDRFGDEDRYSQLTCYYFDDYVKYLFNNDKSRPTSGKSSIFLQSLGSKKENKATQVDDKQTGEGSKTSRKVESNVKNLSKKCAQQNIKDEVKSDSDADIEGTKIAYHKTSRRKSITISRTQSPETVQVIRVDVVCNHSRGSVMSDYEEKKLDSNMLSSSPNIENVEVKKSRFANKYLLTNTIRTLEENLGGEKVTLLCKTFKLSERSRAPSLNKPKTNSEAISNCKSYKKSSYKKEPLIKFEK